MSALEKLIAEQEQADKAALEPLISQVCRLVAADLEVEPLPHRWLLWAQADLAARLSARGVIVRGRVGLIAGRGASGKTILLIQLSVAVATGKPVFGPGSWRANKPEPVLLLLGEEDLGEVKRRFYAATRALSPEDRALVVRYIHFVPLAGLPTALVGADAGNGDLPETARADQVREILRAAKDAGQPYALVVIDPLSRFAGIDTEKDTGGGTRFVQVCETFAAEDLGSPTILIAHHVRKLGKDEDPDSVDLIRGVVSITDAVRWAAILRQMKRIPGAPDILRLSVVKMNYGATPDPVELCRHEGGGGTLRLATAEELEDYGAMKGGRSSALTVDENMHRVLRLLETLAPDDQHGLICDDIRLHLVIGDKPNRAACDAALTAGLIKKLDSRKGLVLTPAGREWLTAKGGEPGFRTPTLTNFRQLELLSERQPTNSPFLRGSGGREWPATAQMTNSTQVSTELHLCPRCKEGAHT